MDTQEKFIIIPSHARTIYNLSGNELIAYGLIYGFSQDEKSWFVGGLQYIADWCGLSSRIRAKEVLQRLLDKGCIRKRETEIERNIRKCDYQAILPVSEKDTAYLKEQRGVSEKDTGVSQTDTNNIDSSIIDNIEEDNSSRIINNTSNNISSIPKKVKKGLDLSFIGIEFRDMFDRYVAYRKETGKPLVQSSAESAYRKLLTLSLNDARTADAIIEQSISNGWQGLFQLKNDNSNYGNSSNKAQQPRNRFCELADSITRTGGGI